MNDERLTNLRHSAAHLLAAAVMDLWPDTKRAIGPAIEDGFYFDFDFGSVKISESDFPAIEAKMREILPSWTKFERHELDAAAAKKQYPKNPFKHEMIDEFSLSGQTPVSFYKSGGYWDLCRGGHVDHPDRELRHFKLLSVAGAYWRGDEKNPMLTRIYATAWPTQPELDAHLNQLEEAKKRDHRKLAKDLEIFTLVPEIGPGLPLWLPNGTIVKDELESWGKETEKKWGYQRVSTPFLTKRDLFVTSGHVPYFEDEMYKVEVPGENSDEQYFIKPMNCPFHHMIYKSKIRSYRDLPLRLAEYGTVARYENAGALNGILRPRVFVQNDAHIYCSESQAVAEFIDIIKLHKYYYDTLGLKDYYIALCLRDPAKKDKYHGEEELWQKSEQLSRDALDQSGVKYEVQHEGAAHYGPKMDFKIKSAIGTEYGISTNQIDLFMPRRFDLKFINNEGQEEYVIVQHRAPLGSSERFVGFLLEHFAGALPTWLSPVQAVILPITDTHLEFASKLTAELTATGVRAQLDSRNEPLNGRIRDAEMQKIPYILVVGDREVAASAVSIRRRGQKGTSSLAVPEFIAHITTEISTKSLA